MSQSNYNSAAQPQREEEIDLREQLDLYLQRWPWFVISLILALTIAFLYLRYATPTYNTVATVIIKDTENNTGVSELSAFADIGMLGGMGTNSIENELGIFRSKRLITNVSRELNLNVRYFQDDLLRSPEVFAARPINVQLLKFDLASYSRLAINEQIHPLYFTINSPTTYVVENREEGSSEELSFGESYMLPYGEISVTPNFEENELATVQKNGTVRVHITTPESAALAYRGRIQVNLTDKNSSMIELGLEDAVRDKAQRILDELIYQYNQEAIEDKNLVSMNTAEFIDERLKIITEELDSVETGKTEFKQENQLTDLEMESQVFIENVSDFRNRQLEVETQIELADAMIELVQNDSEDELLPSNLGFSEEGVGEVIRAYNNLVLERDRILEGSTELNPVIRNLNSQVTRIKATVEQSLQNLRTSLEIARKDFEAQERKLEGQIASVPTKEQQFRNIERQQNIKEALYLYLLQKREETSLNLAVTAPKAKIVDAAYSGREVVSPKKPIVVLGAGIMGLLIPFLFIYGKNLLSNKIEKRGDVEKIISDIPILGEIPKIGKKDEDLVTANDRSVLAEANRILYTNMQYMTMDKGDVSGGRTILTTSTIKGEGKTFVSMNLALTLANMGKKVVLVGADLRNPRLQRYMPEGIRSVGISEYLISQDKNVLDFVQNTSYHPNLKVLMSGNIPPNPAELWGMSKVDEMFDKLRDNYDYIVIDSAPSLLVSDTFHIVRYADLTLYVVRAGYTTKKMLEFPQDAVQRGKLKNVALVLNDVELLNFGYGNKYGYTYDASDIGLWERFKGKF